MIEIRSRNRCIPHSHSRRTVCRFFLSFRQKCPDKARGHARSSACPPVILSSFSVLLLTVLNNYVLLSLLFCLGSYCVNIHIGHILVSRMGLLGILKSLHTQRNLLLVAVEIYNLRLDFLSDA